MLSKPITFVVQIKALSNNKTTQQPAQAWMVADSDDVAKREPCLTAVNDAFNSAADLLPLNNKRKNLYTEEHTPKP